MRSVALVVIFALGLLAASVAAEAQQAGKVPRVGWLRAGRPGSSWELEAFRQGLRELGYVEGQTIVIEYRYAEDQASPADRLTNQGGRGFGGSALPAHPCI